MRPLGRRPGIHNPQSWLWIPGSREDARPGMTISDGHRVKPAHDGKTSAPSRPLADLARISYAPCNNLKNREKHREPTDIPPPRAGRCSRRLRRSDPAAREPCRLAADRDGAPDRAGG